MNKKMYLLTVKSQINIYGGPNSASFYDMSEGCDCCGSGSVPVGPRYYNLNPDKLKKLNIFLTLDSDIIISKQLAMDIQMSGNTQLDEIFHIKTKERLPFYVLKPEKIMPRFSKDTTGYERENFCPKCGRDGHFFMPKVPLKLVYDERVDEGYNNVHVAATWELFGNSILRKPFDDSVFASPCFLVDEFIKNKIYEYAGRRVHFNDVSFA